jgi:PAS domain S-box-containing protein
VSKPRKVVPPAEAARAAPRAQRSSLDAFRDAPDALQSVFENSPDIVMMVDRDRRITYINRSFAAVAPADLLGADACSFVPAASRQVMTASLTRVFRDGVSDRFDMLGPGAEGSTAWYESRVVPIVRDGRVAAALVTSTDVTERVRAERVQLATYRIAESVQTAPSLRDLFEAIHRIVGELMPVPNFYIAVFDAAANTISFPYFVDEYDAPPGVQTPGKGLTEYVLRTGRTLLATPDVAAELERRGEVEVVGAPSIDWLGVPLSIPGGETVGALVVQSYVEDVRYGEAEQHILEFVSTQIAMAIEHKRAEAALLQQEAALRRSEEQYRTLVESAQDVIFALSPEGEVRAVNPAFEVLTGWTLEEWIGRPFVELLHEDDVRATQDLFGSGLRLGRSPNAQFRFRTVAGTYLIGEVHANLHFQDGKAVGILGIVRDITDRVRLEDQLRQAQKMEAVGRLAGGVAHDFNNILTAIGGYSGLLLAEFAPTDPRRADVEEIKKATERAAGLTRQLLAFSRRQVLQPRVLDLNAVIAGAEKLLRRLIGEDIRLVTRLDPALGAVRADAGQVEQVVMNLAVNARDAMENGGTLTIETRNFEVPVSRRVPERDAMAPGRYVQIRVSDTGVGMDAETKRHIFEPFFTTREKGKGTGLGLATVYGIVKQSGGFIWVDSEPGRGAVFTLDLPQVDQRVESAESPVDGRADRIGTETVLVVEDEPQVRTVACEALRSHGYKVLEAPDADVALRVARGSGKTIDLLLTDVVMPGLSGKQLADILAAERPGLRMLFMSGYTDDALSPHGVLAPGVHYLQKPFSPEVLAQKVREVLDLPR